MSSFGGHDIRRLILVPALLTLAVTLLRLVGELSGWSSRFFSAEAGGGGAIVGIAWLPPIFGIYFGLRLRKAGFEPTSAGRIALFALLGFLTMFALVAVVSAASVPHPFNFFLLALGGAVGLVVAMRGWPVLGKTLALYGFAARLPVVVIMFFAIMGRWGTHYDAPPPDFPEGTGPLAEFVLTGLLPQFTVWIAYTVVTGALFAALALKVAARRRTPSPVDD
jgi:hypothetical protein